MKINNPSKFFVATPGSDDYYTLQNRAKVMTRGDVIRKFAATDSPNESDWHLKEIDGEDTWVKFSFDAGHSYPLKFKYKNTLILKSIYKGRPTAGTKMTFDFSGYSDIDFISIRNGRVSVYALNDEGYVTALPFYRYKFNGNRKCLDVILTMDPPEDSTDTMLQLELDGHSAMAMAVPVPVFSAVIPLDHVDSYQYDVQENMGGVLLDGNSNWKSTNYSLVNATELWFSLKSADPNVSGNICIEITCGTYISDSIVIPVSSEDYVSVKVPLPAGTSLTGQLNFRRVADNPLDTLREGTTVIGCYLAQIQYKVYT